MPYEQIVSGYAQVFCIICSGRTKECLLVVYKLTFFVLIMNSVWFFLLKYS